MKSYHLPIEPKESKTKIWIEEYSVKNKTTFNTAEENPGEGELVLRLTFTSNDYSLTKYKKFMDKFLSFLMEQGYN